MGVGVIRGLYPRSENQPKEPADDLNVQYASFTSQSNRSKTFTSRKEYAFARKAIPNIRYYRYSMAMTQMTPFGQERTSMSSRLRSAAHGDFTIPRTRLRCGR